MEIVAIAHSGRAIAASAACSGDPVHVIDCYTDIDTRRVAKSVHQVQEAGYGFDSNGLCTVVKGMLQKFQDVFIVPCSGFEANPELLTVLNRIAPCLGNSENTVRYCKHPETFSGMLSRLSVSHPQICRLPHVCDETWLIKTEGAMGGDHIRRYKRQIRYDPVKQYLQRYVPGQSMSAVFLANGEKCRIVGFNEHIFGNDKQTGSFLFHGAVTIPDIDPSIHKIISIYLDRLVPELHLIGLCGIDFIVDEANTVQIIEINPRPPATFELHEHKQPLFDFHLQACQGILPEIQHDPSHYHAMLNIYATRDIQIHKNIVWPEWTANRPDIGTVIKQHKPVCTFFSEAEDRALAHQLLYDRQNIVVEMLYQGR